MNYFKIYALFIGLFLLLDNTLIAQTIEPGEEIITTVLDLGIAPPTNAPARGEDGEGPFTKLVIKNAYVLDGTGAPTQGPMDIIIEKDRIVNMVGANATSTMHDDGKEYGSDFKVIDATGKYVLPGFIDAHTHLGTPTHGLAGKLTDPEYVLKLWLAHGITTVREVGALMGLNWTLDHKNKSEKGEIVSPRILVHPIFPDRIETPEKAKQWIQAVHKKGADGLKFLGGSPKIIEIAIKEANRLGMRTAFHHSQTSVTRINVLTSARWGLTSMEHWYGLPEAMFENQRIQDYPADYKYHNEQDRFAQAGRLWLQAAGPESKKWRETIEELVALDFTIDPTFTAYEANRDVMRARHVEWHEQYTMPYMTRAFRPNKIIHGSYHFDWTTSDEIAWKKNYQRWMEFINDFKNAGGRVTVGSDSGFIYKLFGFSYIRELEMLQEAGFHPLEVLKAATLNGAELLGLDADIGTVQLGKKADLVIVDENPLANFKILYGTGHLRTNWETGKMERSKGILYTIKDGIVYDAKQLLEDVRNMVNAEKEKESKN